MTISTERLTRPIIGIENRTAQEVFDIMCDRFRHSALASPSIGSVVKPLEWERVTGNGAKRFWRAIDAFGRHLWINVLTDDFEGACSIGERKFPTSAGAMAHLEDAYESRILSALLPSPDPAEARAAVLEEAVRTAKERFDQIDCMGWGGQRIQTMADAYDEMKRLAADGSRRMTAALTKQTEA